MDQNILVSNDPNLEWIDFILASIDTALSGPEFFSLYWSQSRVDWYYYSPPDPSLEGIISSWVSPVQVQFGDHLNTGLHWLDMDWSRLSMKKHEKVTLPEQEP